MYRGLESVPHAAAAVPYRRTLVESVRVSLSEPGRAGHERLYIAACTCAHVTSVPAILAPSPVREVVVISPEKE